MSSENKIPFLGFLLTVALLSTSGPALAQSGGQVPIGTRSIALGEAFVAVADDGSAVYWNPAGLTRLYKQEIYVAYAEPFGLGMDNSYLSYASPLTSRLSAGADWFYTGFEDEEISFSQNRLGLSVGYKLFDWLAVGGTLKRFAMNANMDRLDFASGSGWGTDLGLIISPMKDFRLGLMAQDVGDTKVEYESGLTRRLYSMNIHLGAAYNLQPQLLLVGSLDESAHLGIEYQLHPALSIRAGLQRDLKNNTGMTSAFGLGLNYKLMHLDYAYTVSPDLGPTHYTSLAIAFNFSGSEIDIRGLEIEDLLPAFEQHYARNTMGKVQLVNNSNRPVNATLKLFIPEIMKEPFQLSESIPAGGTKTVKLKSYFDSRFTRIDQERSLPAEIEVSYERSGRLYGKIQTIQVHVHKRNALKWQTIAAAAAFINPKDEATASFVREALVAKKEEQPTGIWTNRPLFQAWKLFDALSQRGVHYRPDPHMPYGQISVSESTIDHIQDQAVLLQTGAGDCDDLTVLYCTLLEQADTETALIDAPGHILMAFNTGLTPDQASKINLVEDTYITRNGRVWIPVEIKLFGQSFQQAWETAAEEYLRLQSQGSIKIIDTHAAWETYPPLSREHKNN